MERELRHVVYDRAWLDSLVEEAPSVYRDIREVLDDEADLVTPVRRLTPLAVTQGLKSNRVIGFPATSADRDRS